MPVISPLITDSSGCQPPLAMVALRSPWLHPLASVTFARVVGQVLALRRERITHDPSGWQRRERITHNPSGWQHPERLAATRAGAAWGTMDHGRGDHGAAGLNSRIGAAAGRRAGGERCHINAHQAGTVGAMGEFALIAAVTKGQPQLPDTAVGPGDDAAVVAAPDGRVVASVDTLVDGVHFRTDWASGEQIGRRAALASMADIAAMGAVPTSLLVAISAPAATPAELVLDIGSGLHEAAREAGAAVIGGDTTGSDTLTISVTVLGDLRGARPVLRSGARPGDEVAIIGRLGWAAAGLAVLSRGFRSPAVMVGAYRVPEPPLQAGIVAGDAGATAMIDVSDGLMADLGHIAEASNVSIDVRTAALEVNPRLLEVAAALGKDPMEWVLTGGDDHPLVATFPGGSTLPPGWQLIGTVGTVGNSGSAVTVDGTAREQPGGWDHFR